jgi:hypothetical protein
LPRQSLRSFSLRVGFLTICAAIRDSREVPGSGRKDRLEEFVEVKGV